ncbi:MAG: biopolymer transporter ExbD [Deltaproteobacteria bacterium]|nr:biopolymer transporter ExbD [Deltaproteobacteria bacterium]MCW5803316.1 biopolymer transporter ExbD [Deltaproteobacteria bacterium]
MAGGSSLYNDEDAPGITEINVTPFVDVALVLLVVFMVTAKLIVARGVEIDKPKAAHGGPIPSTMRVSIDAKGGLHVNGVPIASDAQAIDLIKVYAQNTDKPKAIIAGDRKAQYEGIMRAIDLVQEAGITALALENEK